jgi:hypothetical protein
VSHQDLTAIPDVIVRGTTVEYRRTPSEFPPSTHTLTLLLSGGSGAGSTLSEAGTASGASFVFSLSTADTGTLTPGNYFWEERAQETATSKKYLFASGVLQVTPDLASATPLLTFEAKALAAIEAALVIRLGIGASSSQDVIESYAVGIRQFDKWSTREMMDERARLARIVRNQANPGRFGPQVAIHFTGVNNEPGVPWAPGE